MRIVSLALLLGLAACNQPSAVPGTLEGGKVIATVNGAPITEDILTAVTRGAPKEQLEEMRASGQLKQMIEEQVALGQVLYQRAIDQKLHEKPEVKARIAMAVREALANEIVLSIAESGTTDEKLKEAYEKAKVEFGQPEVKARHILVADEAEAKSIVDMLKAGADFAAIAAEKSTDPGSKANGGDLGWFTKAKMVPEFAEAAFAANAGDIVGPIKTQFGFHVIQVQEKREGKPFEEVKDQLSQRVRRDVVKEYLDAAKAEMKIEWKDEAAVGGAAAGSGSGSGSGEAAPAPTLTPAH